MKKATKSLAQLRKSDYHFHTLVEPADKVDAAFAV
jgi:hypothetical protein